MEYLYTNYCIEVYEINAEDNYIELILIDNCIKSAILDVNIHKEKNVYTIFDYRTLRAFSYSNRKHYDELIYKALELYY